MTPGLGQPAGDADRLPCWQKVLLELQLDGVVECPLPGIKARLGSESGFDVRFTGCPHWNAVVDINLRPVGKQCTASGETFRPGETCWSVLREVDGKIVREDYSDNSWDGPPEKILGHWKCQIPESAEEARKVMDTDALLATFLQLTESPNTAQQDYLYVLALLLLRRKRLILEDNIEVDDEPAMRLLGTGGEGPFDIVERSLTDDQVAEFQEQLFEGSPPQQPA